MNPDRGHWSPGRSLSRDAFGPPINFPKTRVSGAQIDEDTVNGRVLIPGSCSQCFPRLLWDDESSKTGRPSREMEKTDQQIMVRLRFDLRDERMSFVVYTPRCGVYLCGQSVLVFLTLYCYRLP